jgi:uncharacterized protein YndB with AHSA1/START domain
MNMAVRNAGTGAAAETADREIVTSRVFDAPREVVFNAWIDPEQVAQWWGPRGFTNTILEMDVRPGGVWRFIMHGPDGVDYPNKIVFIETVAPVRLVYTHSDDGESPSNPFHVTVTFEEQGGKTRLTMRAVFMTAEERDKVITEFGALEGAVQHLDCLEEHLAAMAYNRGN